jgi:hypothetical protein
MNDRSGASPLLWLVAAAVVLKLLAALFFAQ